MRKLAGDLSGLDGGLLPPHQNYQQPDPAHYHASHSMPMSSPGLNAVAVAPNSAQFGQQSLSSSLSIARFVDNTMNNSSLVGKLFKICYHETGRAVSYLSNCCLQAMELNCSVGLEVE